MYDYQNQISVFIEKNFKKSSPNQANFKVTNSQLLDFLFNTFPVGCIDDYELNQIMVKLKYERHNYLVNDDSGNQFLTSSWCMYTDLIKP